MREETIRTKWAKREKISKKLKKKQIKHSYWNLWDKNLRKQQDWLSRTIKKMISKKTKLKK
ncbi:MAG: hypothetical protein ACD_2C00073G0006 [uncultured bacterium (gcode 4)]|uniref:Uncharacterized protein n=1 Tax=uncultured bacterium (gcode 4) TaxID=1234023 RepID=K2G3T2_9BACT|nr:MAG: hypothetical protein ACD_2C00073G0006 [uncultured bacterium (gcode 4)]